MPLAPPPSPALDRRGSTLTALGLNSSLWKKPPVIIFLLKVITSAGSSKPQCSWAQNLPVQPPPVWTSSTKKAQPCWPTWNEGEINTQRNSPTSDPQIQPKSHCFLNLKPSLCSWAVQNQTKAAGGQFQQGCVCTWPQTAQPVRNRNIKCSLNHRLRSLSKLPCSEGRVSQL